MTQEDTLLLRREDIAALLTMDECIAAVEDAFRLHGEKRTAPPGILGLHSEYGAFHIKAGFLKRELKYFAAKVNANYPENGARFGLPTIQGVIVLCNADNGKPLAIMDSMEITTQRTAAATAVAAKYLARPESARLTLCGCGVQAPAQVEALMSVLRLRMVFAYDTMGERAEKLASRLSTKFGIEAQAVRDLREAMRQSDVCVTCTTSRKAFLARTDAPPGIFIAAVGADHPEKQEIDPELMASARVVTDVTEQSASIGDLHHAIEGGAMRLSDVHAELGELVAGAKLGRQSADEITIFDSTGMALQDVATAAIVYEKAVTAKRGCTIDLAA